MSIPFIMLTLDRPRRLRFGMSSMLEFESVTGLKLRDLDENLSMDATAKLLWVMLRQDEPGLTLEQVCHLVDEHAASLTDIITAVSTAVAAAFSTGDERPNAPTPDIKPGRKPSPRRSTSPGSSVTQ